MNKAGQKEIIKKLKKDYQMILGQRISSMNVWNLFSVWMESIIDFLIEYDSVYIKPMFGFFKVRRKPRKRKKKFFDKYFPGKDKRIFNIVIKLSRNFIKRFHKKTNSYIEWSFISQEGDIKEGYTLNDVIWEKERKDK